jgi:hypothetical protein
MMETIHQHNNQHTKNHLQSYHLRVQCFVGGEGQRRGKDAKEWSINVVLGMTPSGGVLKRTKCEM